MRNKNKGKLSKFEKEMQNLSIRKLSIYDREQHNEANNAPQFIMNSIAKIFHKTMNEFIKCKIFSTKGYQQIQINMNYVKYFFRENLITDFQNFLDGFFYEIMKNCSWNTIHPETFNEGVKLYINILIY